MNKCIFVLFLSIIFSSSSYSSEIEKLPKSYKENAIYFKYGFSGKHFVQNGDTQGTGLFYRNLREAMNRSPEAVAMVSKANRKEKIGIATAIGSLLIALSAASGVGAVVGLGGYFWGVNHALASQNDMYEAVWLHNGILLN